MKPFWRYAFYYQMPDKNLSPQCRAMLPFMVQQQQWLVACDSDDSLRLGLARSRHSEWARPAPIFQFIPFHEIVILRADIPVFPWDCDMLMLPFLFEWIRFEAEVSAGGRHVAALIWGVLSFDTRVCGSCNTMQGEEQRKRSPLTSFGLIMPSMNASGAFKKSTWGVSCDTVAA